MDTTTENTQALGLSWDKTVTDLKLTTQGRLEPVQQGSNIALAYGEPIPLPSYQIHLAFYNIWNFEKYETYVMPGSYKGNVLPAAFDVMIGHDPGVGILGAWDTDQQLNECDFDTKTNEFTGPQGIEGANTDYQPDVTNAGENNYCVWLSKDNQLEIASFSANTTRAWSKPITIPVPAMMRPTEGPCISKLNENNLLITWVNGKDVFYCVHQLGNENQPFSEPRSAPYQTIKPMSTIYLSDGKGIAAMTGENEGEMARTARYSFDEQSGEVDWDVAETVFVEEFIPESTPTLFLRGSNLLMFATCENYHARVISATGTF